MLMDEEEYLAHYGILRRSGRYPWGSGKNKNTRNKIFLDYVEELQEKGLSEVKIAEWMEISTKELRDTKTEAKAQQKQAEIALAQRLKDKGVSVNEIGKRMHRNESSVRALLAPGASDKANVIQSTANALESEIKANRFVDVGAGVEHLIGVTRNRLDVAVTMLVNKGYELLPVNFTQLGTGKETHMKVLCPPGTTQKELWANRNEIVQMKKFTEDFGRNYYGLHDPIKLNPNRVQVVYGKDGGKQADGVIYVRPGIQDVDLGGASYAQVRVAVGDGHYIKGMAIYKDDLPKGIDLVFNTKAEDTGNKLDAFKAVKDDPENPFGSMVRQIVENPNTPDERVTSSMNIVNEEGKWAEWSRTLSTQMLSKQDPTLARQQLDVTYENRIQEHEDIMALTNPTVRKKLLEDFSGSVDSAAVHLKAAALPQQAVHVILPIQNMPPTQVYAPNYVDGTTVVLIRHPHGGTFEIPRLTVNNNNPEAKTTLGNARDAIGIHHTVAERLSGADFDGDTVLVIPDPRGQIKDTPALDALKNFDPISAYPAYEGMPKMKNTQAEMGKISNLITDMTIHDADGGEIARAVKHSMVVIDAEKHNLNYKLSYNDNGIKELKKKYQTGGASTLISRAKAPVRLPQREERRASAGGHIDPVTGELVFVPTNKKSYTGKPLTTKTTRLAEAKDALTLSSGTRMEIIYAEHSNRLKALANQSRLESLRTPPAEWSTSAKKTYAKDVESLNAKLSLAKENSPLERQAQLLATTWLKARKDANPDMDDETYAKIKWQTLEEARFRTGSGKKRIRPTQEEWDAIQAGAISNSKLNEILYHADMDSIRKLATPRDKPLMTSNKIQRAQAMLDLGYTRAEIAHQLGVSITTLDRGLH